MNQPEMLLNPAQCVMLFVDFQAGLAFGVESTTRQMLLNNAVALARTAQVFAVPVIASTSASRVYSGPLFPVLQAALPGIVPIERRNMNVWEDERRAMPFWPAAENVFWWRDCSQRHASLFLCCPRCRRLRSIRGG